MRIAITSLLSPASDHRVVRLVDDLTAGGLHAEFVDGTWDERHRAVVDGRVDATWVCGLLHVDLQATSNWPLQVVAAPRAETSPHAPEYFGRIVVRAGSSTQRFEDLRGCSFAFNEPASLSGYRMMLDRLHQLGADLGFFARTVASGSHLESIRLVASGEVDCAIIDSIVFDDVSPIGVRVVETVGPYPAPPLVARPSLAPLLAEAAPTAGWAPMTESAYDQLRRPPHTAG